MSVIFLTTFSLVFTALTFAAWRRYLWAAEKGPRHVDTCPYSLTDVFADDHLISVPHQKGIRWLTEVFSRSAEKFPDLTALQIPYTGESLTFAELDARAERVAAAVSPFLTGPDQVVAVAMPQDMPTLTLTWVKSRGSSSSSAIARHRSHSSTAVF